MLASLSRERAWSRTSFSISVSRRLELFVALDEAGERDQDLGGTGERHRHVGCGFALEGLDGFDAPDRHHLRAVLFQPAAFELGALMDPDPERFAGRHQPARMRRTPRMKACRNSKATTASGSARAPSGSG